jgi:hypothetical protein
LIEIKNRTKRERKRSERVCDEGQQKRQGDVQMFSKALCKLSHRERKETGEGGKKRKFIKVGVGERINRNEYKYDLI